MRSIPAACLLSLIIPAAGQAAGPARNAILLIGDGMGAAQRTLAHYCTGVVPAMDQLPVVGMMNTEPAPEADEGVIEVTDSAAAATALACGIKTHNDAIAVDTNGREVPTVLEAAMAAGKASGLVVTCQVNHATPAGFAAHEESRDSYDAIAADYLTSRPTVILGGGTDYFLPEGHGGARRDGRDLEEEFRRAGYAVIHDANALAAVTQGPLLGLFAPRALTPAIDRQAGTPEPTLAQETAKAIEILSRDPDGFFLLVEGSQIDWGCHAHDAPYALGELLSFDEAVEVARNFAARDGETLVVVLADHETGGLAIGRRYRFDAGGLGRIHASLRKIAEVMDQDPTSREETLVSLAELDSLTAEERQVLAEAQNTGAGVADIVNRRVGLGWNGSDHSGTLIPVTAGGAGAERFGGVYDNTEVATKLAAALDIPFRPGGR